MVNKDPSEVDEDTLPDITEPVDRDTVDNFLVGAYRTEEDGVWRLEIRDWANRVVESTVYEADRDDAETVDGVAYSPLDTPEDMDDEAYLVELLNRRVDGLDEELEAEAA